MEGAFIFHYENLNSGLVSFRPEICNSQLEHDNNNMKDTATYGRNMNRFQKEKESISVTVALVLTAKPRLTGRPLFTRR